MNCSETCVKVGVYTGKPFADGRPPAVEFLGFCRFCPLHRGGKSSLVHLQPLPGELAAELMPDGTNHDPATQYYSCRSGANIKAGHVLVCPACACEKVDCKGAKANHNIVSIPAKKALAAFTAGLEPDRDSGKRSSEKQGNKPIMQKRWQIVSLECRRCNEASAAARRTNATVRRLVLKNEEEKAEAVTQKRPALLSGRSSASKKRKRGRRRKSAAGADGARLAGCWLAAGCAGWLAGGFALAPRGTS